ncbi:hypothetical protein KY289_018387 [Solanum tuberosum]|nr:hypothetical protein KY289_018387 [Solanum tuberosum]
MRWLCLKPELHGLLVLEIQFLTSAFAVAKFIQKGGSFINYYMYHGGANFGRTAGGPFIATSYDYDAPLDEYNMHFFFVILFRLSFFRLLRQPKWGQLKDLHRAMKLCEPALVPGDPAVTALGHQKEIGAQSAQMKMTPVSRGLPWQSFNEGQHLMKTIDSREKFLRGGKWPWLTIMSAGHALHVFVNGQLAGTAYGSLEKPKLAFSKAVNLRAVSLSGLDEGKIDLTWQKWSYKVGLKGEALNLHSLSGSSSVKWVEGSLVAQRQPLTWYKSTFNAPAGNDPLASDLNTMGKGQVWINGQSLGRYWPGYKASGNCGACNYAGWFDEKKCLTSEHHKGSAEASEKEAATPSTHMMLLKGIASGKLMLSTCNTRDLWR